MTVLTNYIAATIGACVGFAACALLNAGKGD